MSDIARWDLTTSRLHEHGQLTIIPDVLPASEGGWVRYDDIASLLEYRDEILVALLEESTYDGLYARLMDLHERGE